MRGLGMMLLAIWLIAVSAVFVFAIPFPGGAELIGVLGIAAGALLIYENRAGIARNVGTFLVSLWLIVNGLTLLVPSLTFNGLGTLLLLLALAGGVFVVVEAMARGAAKNLGLLLLGVFLIASNVLPLLNVTTPFLYTTTFVIGIAAGILILLRR